MAIKTQTRTHSKIPFFENRRLSQQNTLNLYTNTLAEARVFPVLILNITYT